LAASSDTDMVDRQRWFKVRPDELCLVLVRFQQLDQLADTCSRQWAPRTHQRLVVVEPTPSLPEIFARGPDLYQLCDKFVVDRAEYRYDLFASNRHIQPPGICDRSERVPPGNASYRS